MMIFWQMVRHEAAEAAGAVLDDLERSQALLREFVDDKNRVVAESCIVALDIADYWADDAQLHYADVA
jgi:deoxyhypusine monooxygenase